MPKMLPVSVQETELKRPASAPESFPVQPQPDVVLFVPGSRLRGLPIRRAYRSQALFLWQACFLEVIGGNGDQPRYAIKACSRCGQTKLLRLRRSLAKGKC